jgi:hypothetical protein
LPTHEVSLGAQDKKLAAILFGIAVEGPILNMLGRVDIYCPDEVRTPYERRGTGDFVLERDLLQVDSDLMGRFTVAPRKNLASVK